MARSRGLGDVYKRQGEERATDELLNWWRGRRRP
jgi:hypothetical protein